MICKAIPFYVPLCRRVVLHKLISIAGHVDVVGIIIYTYDTYPTHFISYIFR
jgi:hypothetical protein